MLKASKERVCVRSGFDEGVRCRHRGRCTESVFGAGIDDGVRVTLQASRALRWASDDGVSVSAAGIQGDGVCRRGEHIAAG